MSRSFCLFLDVLTWVSIYFYPLTGCVATIVIKDILCSQQLRHLKCIKIIYIKLIRLLLIILHLLCEFELMPGDYSIHYYRGEGLGRTEGHRLVSPGGAEVKLGVSVEGDCAKHLGK